MGDNRATIGRRVVGPAAAALLVACGSATLPDVAPIGTTTTAGALIVNIGGLPATVQGKVTVLGTGYSTPVGITTVLPALAPGIDTITVDSVVVPGVFTGIAGITPSEQSSVVYRATLVGLRLSVDSNGVTTVPIIADSVTGASVTYVAPAAPVVTMSMSNAIAMTGQKLQVTWSSTGATACWGQGDGAWTSAPSVATSGTQSLVASGGANQLSYISVTCVGRGGGSFTDQAVLEQSNTIAGTGDLTVFAYGLPGGVGASTSITVVGQTTPAGGVWTGLAPGTYTVNAAPVVANGVTYTPTPGSQTVRVAADSESGPLVTYSAPGPTAAHAGQRGEVPPRALRPPRR